MSTDVVHLHSPETYNYTSSKFFDFKKKIIQKNWIFSFLFLTHTLLYHESDFYKLCLPYADGVCSVMQDE